MGGIYVASTEAEWPLRDLVIDFWGCTLAIIFGLLLLRCLLYSPSFVRLYIELVEHVQNNAVWQYQVSKNCIIVGGAFRHASNVLGQALK